MEQKTCYVDIKDLPPNEKESWSYIIDINAYMQANDCENRYTFHETPEWIILADKVGYIFKFDNWKDCKNFMIAFNWGVRTRF